MLSFEPWMDHWGFLVTMPNEDAGDSAQKMGLYRFGRYIQYKSDSNQLGKEQAKFAQELDGLEDSNKKGYYCRHPDTQMWWGRSNNFSRDQQRSLVMAMGALKQKKRLFIIFIKHLMRLGFYQNNMSNDNTTRQVPDFASPDIIGEYIRAFYMAGFKFLIVLWPLLMITDLFALLGLCINFAFNWSNPDNSDDDNLIMATLQAKMALPTPISWINKLLYKKFRPIAGYTDETKTISLASIGTTMNGPQSALAWKQRLATGAPPFYSQYENILKGL